MNVAQLVFGCMSATILFICSAAAQEQSKSQMHEMMMTRRYQQSSRFVQPDASVIPSSFSSPGVLDPSCNTAVSHVKAWKIVRLKIMSGLLSHLLDGQSCNQCLEFGSTRQQCTNAQNCQDADGGGATSLPPVTAPAPHAPSGTYTTRLDIALTRSVWAEPNGRHDPILIKIVLNDANMAFMRSPGATPTDSIDAVRAVPAGMFDCRQPISATSPESVEFRIKYPGAAPKTGSLNIGVTIPAHGDAQGFTLPIILDPKVPNNG